MSEFEWLMLFFVWCHKLNAVCTNLFQFLYGICVRHLYRNCTFMTFIWYLTLFMLNTPRYKNSHSLTHSPLTRSLAHALVHLFTHSFGNTHHALETIGSYHWTSCSNIRKKPKETPLKCPPKSPILGPLLFPIYNIPLANIIRSHGLSYHLYADHSQLYIELCLDKNTSHTADISKVERCVAIPS